MLLDAKKQLKEVIEGKLADAASSNDHTTVLRFVRLYAPLQLKVSSFAWPIAMQLTKAWFTCGHFSRLLMSTFHH